MKKLPLIAAALLTISPLSASNLSPEGGVGGGLTQYVDPFIGSIGTGHTFPGACVPFGMIQASPVTGAVGWDYCSEYIGTDDTIWGFTQNHLNGTGCMDLGDILVMPVSGNTTQELCNQVGYPSAPECKTPTTLKGAYSKFSKQSESAKPGYYSVYLDKPQTKVEITARPHVAMYRFTYDDVQNAGVFIDLNHGPAWNEKQHHEQVTCCEVQVDDDYTISGHVRNVVWVEQDYWFVLKFSKPMARQHFLKMDRKENGKRIIADFNLKKGETVDMKVAMSSYSLDGARKNLKAEDTTFEKAVVEADDTWNSYLSRIEVTPAEGMTFSTEEQLKNFYTSFYHALIQPNNIADVDGHYRDSKGNPAKCEQGNEYYSTFSCWDTYRAAHPFYTIIVQEKVDPFVRSMVDFAESEGHLPIWGLWGRDNYCMVANHAIPIVAEAYHKGFRGFDAERAFQAIKKTETVSHPLKSDWEIYMRYGYFPTDSIKAESVSSTLETVYDDYAAWDMATLMGKTEDAAYFAKRKEFFRNLFDPETGYMRPRNTDGTWKTPFYPTVLDHAESSGGDYTEGNAWQYTWHLQHDVPALIELLGGNKVFVDRLDEFFNTELVSTIADVSGLIGQYAHGNEPSHHVAYLYALAGKPEKTQDVVREIFDTQYTPKADGLCGNDDCGQMSAWYMLSAMGFYPVDPVSAEYVIGAPQMQKIVLNLPEGKTFTMEAKNLSKTNKHVAKILLNGKPYKQNTIKHEDIVNGGTLTFVMKK